LNPVGQNSTSQKFTFYALKNPFACYPDLSPFHAVISAQTSVELGLYVSTWNREKQEAQLSLGKNCYSLQPTQFLMAKKKA